MTFHVYQHVLSLSRMRIALVGKQWPVVTLELSCHCTPIL